MTAPLFSEATLDRVIEWRNDGEKFVKEVFGAEPDFWQREALKAWVSNDRKTFRIALQACTGPGKTAVLAWCAWHFLFCRADEKKHPNAFAVSITAENLRDNLWKELQVWRLRSKLLQKHFEWQKESIFSREYPDTWWLRARSFSKSADKEAQGRTLSGLHAPYIAYFIDEAGDMAPSLLRTAEQGLGKGEEWGKILLAGNPTSLLGALYVAAVAQAKLYTVIRITGDPDDPRRSPRINIENAREQIDLWGRDNPWVMATILGLFPPASLNALFSPDQVREAMERKIQEHQYSFSQKRIGIDVARFGDDRTVLFPRQGLRAFKPVEMRGAKTTEIAARIAAGKRNFGSEMEIIDDTGGWGAGVIDQCELAGIQLVAVNSSSTHTFDHRYFNRRAEMFFGLSEWVKQGGVLPYVPQLISELSAIRYWFNKGKFQILEKDQIKVELGGVSPDYADALAETFALPDMPAEMDDMPGLPDHLKRELRGGMVGNIVGTDYDPLENM